ncbi:acyltransferase family protein [Clostridium sp. CTA-7]
MEKRIDEVDIIKGIAILLVFIGHAATNSFLPRPSTYEFIVQFIYAFHMPLFFMISGFLSVKSFNMNLKKDYIKFIKNKFNRLMIPFITISLITNGLMIIAQVVINKEVNIQNIFEMFKTTAVYPENAIMGALWFLYALFIVSVLSPILDKFSWKFIVVIGILINIFTPKNLYFLALNRVSFFLIYYFIGMYIRKVYDLKNKINYKCNKYIIIVSAAIIAIYSTIITKGIILNQILMNIYMLICGILGIILALYFAIFIKKYNSLKLIFSKLGNYSMDIYIFSWFFQVASMIFITKVIKLDSYNIFFISNFIIGSLSLPFSIFIVRRIPLIRFLFLGIPNKVSVYVESNMYNT